MTCASPLRIAAPFPRLRLVGDDPHRAVAELAQHVAGAVGAAVVDDHDLEVDRQVDRAHAAHDLDDGVALVEHRHDHRQLAVVVRRLQLCHRASGTSRACGRDLRGGRPWDANRAPARRARCRDAAAGDRRSGSGSNTRSRSAPVTSSTSSASSSMVNSSGLPMFIGPTWSDSSRREQPVDLVAHVAERAGLLAVAVDGERLAAHRLREEVRHDPPVGRAEPGPVGVEDAHDLGVDAVLAVVRHRDRFGVALRLVVHRARPDAVDVAEVALGLRVHERVAVDLAGRREQEARAVRSREVERVARADRADLEGLDRMREVLGRARGAGEVQHRVDRAVDGDARRSRRARRG